MNRSGFARWIGRSKRLAWLLVVFASPAIVVDWRGSKERPVPSAGIRTATPGTQQVVVEQLGMLQKTINETGVATTGVARGVRLVREGKDLTPQLGIQLREGDRILTDGSTRAVIGSETGPKISLGANSDLTLRKASGFLSLGSLLLSIKGVFRLETEFVVAGVKGTEFALSVGSGAVMAFVVEGRVKVESKGKKWAPRSYTEGEQCVVRGDAEPRKLTRRAIRAFHRRDYYTAVALYDQALLADPNDAYLLNLKAYSLFKSKRLSEAIDVQSESTRVYPYYAWGFFDLARFQCAAGDFDGARKSIKIALEKRPELSKTMEGDGEFQRLCRPVLK